MHSVILSDKITIPSLIKWTGSKRSQALEIMKIAPSYNQYYEPFLGGGAMLFLANKNGAVAGDIYKPLIDFWSTIKEDPQLVIDNYLDQWTRLQLNLPDYFYEVRDRFNKTPNGLDLAFLTRTCVNGIVRFNNEGKFNNSFHLSRKGMHPDRFKKIVWTWNKSLQNVTLMHNDYVDTISRASAGDFVYLDPPYAGNKDRYVADLDLERFFGVLEDLNHRNVHWALSFDGTRGDQDLVYEVPKSLYKKHMLIASGNSAVKKVLSKSVDKVFESLYINF